MNLKPYIWSIFLLIYSPFLWANSALDAILLDSAKIGNLRGVESVIKQGADINAFDKNGNTALLYAAIRGDYLMVNHLLAKGALPNMDNKKGYTPLILSCIKGHLSSVEFLLNHGADYNQANAAGETPLIVCAEYNQKVATEMLLKHNADVNHQDKKGNTALHIALKNNHERIVMLLLANGADYTKENRDGMVPFEFVCQKDDDAELKLMKQLCTTHPKLITTTFSRKKTLLMIVASKNCPKLGQYLIEQGADIHSKDSEGMNALTYALYANSLDMAKFLLAKGSKMTDLTVMGFALIADFNPNAIGLMLSEGFDINRLDARDYTAMHLSVTYNLVNLCRLLLKNGADINVMTSKGETPLNLAIHLNKDAMIKLLLDSGADINQADTQGNTPLMKACVVGNGAVVELLINRGAYLLAKNKSKKSCYDLAHSNKRSNVLSILAKNGLDGKTVIQDDVSDSNFRMQLISGSYALIQHLINLGANVNGVYVQRGGYEDHQGVRQYYTSTQPMLHAATKNKDFNVAKLLVEKGAKIDAVDHNGHTALYAAVVNNRLDIVKYLVEKGLDVKALCQNGDTLLMKACYIANMDMVNYLIEKGLDVNEQGTSKGASSLICCVESNSADKFKVMELLLLKGADINYCAAKTGTALHRACALFDLPAIEFLLSKKANPNVKNEQGETALDLAKKDNRADVVALLKKHDAVE